MAWVLTDVGLWMGAMDITGFSGNFQTQQDINIVPVKRYDSLGYTSILPGEFSAKSSVKGNADFAAGGISQTFKSTSAGAQQLFTISVKGSAAAAGDACTFVRGRLNSMNMLSGDHGAVAGFDMAMMSDEAEVEGLVLAPMGSRGTTVGTQVSGVPAVTASQRVIAGLHVTGAVGTNLAVKVQSATTADTGFASPTDRITFATVSATGWQFLVLGPGAITDTRWRMNATSTSTFTYAVVFGVI